MGFIYFIIGLCVYIGLGITTFGIAYKYNFMDTRSEYIRECQQGNGAENSSIFMTIVFWPFLMLIILFIYIPKRLVTLLINEINEDMKYDKLFYKETHDDESKSINL